MNNKSVLITGAAKRLGAAIARHLHGLGMNIIIHYNRSSDQAGSLGEELNRIRPDSVKLIRADLNNESSLDMLVEQALSFNSRLDALINNASGFYPTPVLQVTSEQWNDLVTINLKAPFFLSQKCYPHLRETGGCIINILDIHADRPLKNYPVYSISKAGLVMVTRSLAREFGPDVRVNGVSPGAILWPEDTGENTRKEITERTALKRSGETRDIATAVAYLINDAAYVTGEILVVDGGRSLNQ